MGFNTKENCWLNELFVNRYRIVQLSALMIEAQSFVFNWRIKNFGKTFTNV
jgi:hypothetical protein